MKRNQIFTKKDIEYFKNNLDVIIGIFGLSCIILAVLNFGTIYWIFGIPLLIIAASIKSFKLYKLYLRNKKIEITKLKYNFDRIDEMTPYEFEKFIADGLKSIGYKTEVTKGSGDFGVDVIAKYKSENVAIQVKHYKGKVGYDAVKEVVSGGKFNRCNQYWVVTSNEHGFTRQAKIGARQLDVKLLNINDYALLLNLEK